MGKLINGEWHDVWYDTKQNQGKFVREEAGFRHWIENRAAATFQPESGRYHLYVSLACPWAHRTMIFRHLKGLESHIDVTIVCPDMLSEGWKMGLPEPLFGHTRLHQIYTQAQKDYTEESLCLFCGTKRPTLLSVTNRLKSFVCSTPNLTN